MRVTGRKWSMWSQDARGVLLAFEKKSLRLSQIEPDSTLYGNLDHWPLIHMSKTWTCLTESLSTQLVSQPTSDSSWRNWPMRDEYRVSWRESRILSYILSSYNYSHARFSTSNYITKTCLLRTNPHEPSENSATSVEKIWIVIGPFARRWTWIGFSIELTNIFNLNQRLA